MILLFLLFLTLSSAFISDFGGRQIRYRNKFFDTTNFTLDGIAQFPVPYIVSIQTITGNEHLCAGTIIDESFVLTAAHCFYKIKDPKKLSIVAGSNLLMPKSKYANRYRVSKIIQHEDFVPLKGPDIALLKMEHKFKFDGKKIDKINFNSSGATDDMDGYMIGWGHVKKNSYKKLELVSFSAIPNDKCVRRRFYYVKATEICAISFRGRGACDGDSGGPLVNSYLNMQIGILSYGRKPCIQGRIYAFTKISSLYKWILKNLRKYS